MARTILRIAAAAWAAGLLGAAPAAAADEFAPQGGLEDRIGKEIRLELDARGFGGLLSSPTVGGDVVIAKDSDKILALGGNVHVRDTQANIVAGAAGTLTIENSTIGRIRAAAGNVIITDTTVDDISLAAGEVSLSAAVNGDVTIYAGETTLSSATTVNGDADIKGGQITVAGIINGDLEIVGERLVLSGTINGDADVRAETITLLPGAAVRGDFVYTSNAALSVPEDAAVNGEIRRREGGTDAEHEYNISVSELFGGGLTGWFLGLLTLGVCGAAALALAPVVMTSAGQIVGKEPLPSLGVGAALLIGVPVAAALLGVTVIGIPLAALLVAAYVIALGLGLITACLWGGDRIRALLKQDGVEKNLARRMGWVVLAFIAFVVIGSVPMVGGIAQILAVVAGTGAVVLAAWARRGVSAPS